MIVLTYDALSKLKTVTECIRSDFLKTIFSKSVNHYLHVYQYPFSNSTIQRMNIYR